MIYRLQFYPEAEDDYEAFNEFQKNQIDKAISKILKNPLPQSDGGYGKPLGNKRGKNLTELCKIKLKKLGIRVIYEVIRTENTVDIIVIAARADDEVYNIAEKRIAGIKSQ